MARTNSNGEVILDLDIEQDYQYYTLCGDVETTYPTQKITSNPVYLEVDRFNNQLKSFTDFESLTYDYSLEKAGNVSYFKFVYNDKSSQITKSCLRVYEWGVYNNVYLGEHCLTSPSGTLYSYDESGSNFITLETGKKYFARGFITLDGEEASLEPYVKQNYESTEVYRDGVGLLGTTLIIILFALIGAYFHPFGVVIMGLFGMLISSLIGALNVQISSLLTLSFIIGAFILWRLKK